MNCPKCGYKMADTDLDCPRCAKYARRDSSALPIEPTFPPPLRAVPSKAHMDAYFFMWVLTLIAWSMVISYCMGYPRNNAVLGFIADTAAVVIAIFLVCQANTADKVNGWLKIGLEIFAFLVGFASALHPAS